jgi:hypothetical protein
VKGEIISKKAVYLRDKVDCVREIKFMIMNPTNAEVGGSTINGLFAQIAHYINPSNKLLVFQMPVYALNFMTNIINIWDSAKQKLWLNSVLHASLHHIKSTFLSQVFLKALEGGISNQKILIAILDFLCSCARS